MTRNNLFCWSMLSSLLAIACSGPPPASIQAEHRPFDLNGTRQLITEQNKHFTDAHLAGDVAAIDSMFTADAKSYPPGSPAVSGLPAMHAYTVEFLKAGLTEFREVTTDFYGNAEYVTDAGTYVATYGPDHVTERGKYLNVWQQLNGTWKIKSNMWNSDAPAATPK